MLFKDPGNVCTCPVRLSPSGGLAARIADCSFSSCPYSQRSGVTSALGRLGRWMLARTHSPARSLARCRYPPARRLKQRSTLSILYCSTLCYVKPLWARWMARTAGLQLLFKLIAFNPVPRLFLLFIENLVRIVLSGWRFARCESRWFILDFILVW